MTTLEKHREGQRFWFTETLVITDGALGITFSNFSILACYRKALTKWVQQIKSLPLYGRDSKPSLIYWNRRLKVTEEVEQPGQAVHLNANTLLRWNDYPPANVKPRLCAKKTTIHCKGINGPPSCWITSVDNMEAFCREIHSIYNASQQVADKTSNTVTVEDNASSVGTTARNPSGGSFVLVKIKNHGVNGTMVVNEKNVINSTGSVGSNASHLDFVDDDNATVSQTNLPCFRVNMWGMPVVCPEKLPTLGSTSSAMSASDEDAIGSMPDFGLEGGLIPGTSLFDSDEDISTNDKFCEIHNTRGDARGTEPFSFALTMGLSTERDLAVISHGRKFKSAWNSIKCQINGFIPGTVDYLKPVCGQVLCSRGFFIVPAQSEVPLCLKPRRLEISFVSLGIDSSDLDHMLQLIQAVTEDFGPEMAVETVGSFKGNMHDATISTNVYSVLNISAEDNMDRIPSTVKLVDNMQNITLDERKRFPESILLCFAFHEMTTNNGFLEETSVVESEDLKFNATTEVENSRCDVVHLHGPSVISVALTGGSNITEKAIYMLGQPDNMAVSPLLADGPLWQVITVGSALLAEIVRYI